MSALHRLDARTLLARYRAGDVSPVEVVRDTLNHIDRCEPQLRACWLLFPDAALAAARASEQRWRMGAPQGPLDGVPVTLKENIATAGDPVPMGTAATTLEPAVADSPPAARLREAGAIVLAKTTMPDYGMLTSGLSSFHALSRNPWDTMRTPGGSSAGAGAAAAAAYGPLHLGTDIGGSIRLPAAWCGVFGLKPSLGRIPIDPPYTGRVAGPMTRTVADAALLMASLSRPDRRDCMNLPPQDIDWSLPALDSTALRGLRIGLLLDAGCGLAVEPAIVAAVQKTADSLARAGAQIIPMAPFFTREMLDGMDRFWRMRCLRELSALPEGRRQRVLPYIRAWAESASNMTGVQVYDAVSQFHHTRVSTHRACAPFDFVLSPTAPVSPPPADWASPTNDPLRPLEHIAFTVPFNMSEQPAASIPVGVTEDGLPIGVQIAGARFDDAGVLRLSALIEALRGPLPVPALSA
jgi:aspartyl-tRNA(Asn)/glutamyl-tRNA(Gln) amidotransferase subunit A